jgi:hypothetical protein
MLKRIENGNDVGVRRQFDPTIQILVIGNLFKDEVCPQIFKINNELAV